MRLIREVKKLREEFPQLKIRQLVDGRKVKYAEITLPQCAETIKVFFECECIIVDFYGCATVYGYRDRDFSYMISELRNLIECRTLVIAAEYCGGELGNMLASADCICEEYIYGAVKQFCIIKNNFRPKNVFVNMHYCNSELDYTEFFSEVKI